MFCFYLCGTLKQFTFKDANSFVTGSVKAIKMHNHAFVLSFKSLKEIASSKNTETSLDFDFLITLHILNLKQRFENKDEI